MSEVTLRVNGETHTLDLDPSTRLLYVLRNDLGLRGPRFGDRLLAYEGNARGLCVKTQHPGAWVLGAELVAHDGRPHPPSGPELRDLLKEVIVTVEEKG